MKNQLKDPFYDYYFAPLSLYEPSLYCTISPVGYQVSQAELKNVVKKFDLSKIFLLSLAVARLALPLVARMWPVSQLHSLYTLFILLRTFKSIVASSMLDGLSELGKNNIFFSGTTYTQLLLA